MRKSIGVAAAAIVNDQSEILIARRAADQAFAGQWEFPGGKIENGETAFQALVREIQEELGVAIHKAQSLGVLHHAYDHLDVQLEVFLVRWQPQAITLTEHSEVRWVAMDQLQSWPLAAADIPFVARIRQKLQNP